MATRFADPEEREWAAATLQVLFRRLRDTQTLVVIGEPISPGRFGQRAAIHAAMAALLARVGNRHDGGVAVGERAYQRLAANM